MKKNCTIFPQPLNVLTLDTKGKKEGLPLLKPYDGDFPGSPVVKNLPAMQETPIRFLGQEVPLWEG